MNLTAVFVFPKDLLDGSDERFYRFLMCRIKIWVISWSVYTLMTSGFPVCQVVKYGLFFMLSCLHCGERLESQVHPLIAVLLHCKTLAATDPSYVALQTVIY